jgi:ornithine carbamoyltransferase
MRHLLEIDDLTKDELFEVIALALDPNPPQVLSRKGMALVFQKPSARTRNSMEMAVKDLGGHPVTIRAEEVSIDERESAEDVARTLACYHAAIGARVFDHSVLERMAAVSWVPVVNMLSDDAHPLQALADLLTMADEFGDLNGRTLAYIGDGNNMARSLAVACGKFGMRFICATPAAYALPSDDMDGIMAQVPGMDFATTTDPTDAVREADVIYTDTWTSMGQEAEKQQRIKDFQGFQINDSLMKAAPKHAVIMHCLPAYRDLEITDSAMESKQSLVFPQAENRLHFQKALIAVLMGKA